MCWCQIWLYSPGKWLVYFFFSFSFFLLYCISNVRTICCSKLQIGIELFMRLSFSSELETGVPKKTVWKCGGCIWLFLNGKWLIDFFFFFLLESSQRAAFYHRLLAFPELKVSEKDWLDAQNPHQFYSFFLVIVCLCISSRYSQAGDVRGGGFWIDRFEKSSVHFPQQVAYMYVFWL